MQKANYWAIALCFSLGSQVFLHARPRAPLPDTANDGGMFSAESLGRGNVMASNKGSPAAGSENPAGLADSRTNASYATALVHTQSDLDADTASLQDPLSGKVLQYIAIQGDKGVIFYEPVSRLNQRQILDPASPSTDYQDVEYSANAIGLAGAEKVGAGSFGLSIAYLWSAINVDEHHNGQPDQNNFDTSDGLRLNLGVRYPTGPAMWGIMLQNGPGFLWGKDYESQMLPVRVRIGNTVRLAKGVFLSADWERRFYHEGSHPDNYLYLGSETYFGEYIVARIGMFGTDINKSETRHGTAGLGIVTRGGAKITYAIDTYEETNVRVKRSFVSLEIPFDSAEETGSSR